MAKKLEHLVGLRFSQMTYEQKLEELQKIRKSRSTLKATSKVVKKRKKATAKSTDKLDKLFDSLSPEDRAKFLEGLSE